MVTSEIDADDAPAAWLASVAGAAAIGAAAGGFLWFLGMPVAAAVAVAAFALAVGVGWAAGAASAVPGYRGVRAAVRPGARTDLTQLTWALRERHGGVSDTGRRRLQSFGRSRMLSHGVDLADPAQHAAAIALVGDRAYETLTAAHAPALSDIEHVLDSLDAIVRDGVPRAGITQGGITQRGRGAQ